MDISWKDQCMTPKICQLFLPFKVMGGHNGKLWAGIALSAQNSLLQCSDIFRLRSPYWWRKITPLEWPLKPFSGPIFFSFRPFLQINTDQVWFYLKNVILVPSGLLGSKMTEIQKNFFWLKFSCSWLSGPRRTVSWRKNWCHEVKNKFHNFRPLKLGNFEKLLPPGPKWFLIETHMGQNTFGVGGTDALLIMKKLEKPFLRFVPFSQSRPVKIYCKKYLLEHISCL